MFSKFPNPLSDLSTDSNSRAYESAGCLILMYLLALGAAIITFIYNPEETPDSPVNRQILLDVPQKSSVNAQVISGDSRVHLQNL